MPRHIPRARKPPQSSSHLVNRLFEIANDRGLRQTDVARKMGVYTSAVQRWYAGQNNPTIRIVEELAQALNVRIKIEED